MFVIFSFSNCQNEIQDEKIVRPPTLNYQKNLNWHTICILIKRVVSSSQLIFINCNLFNRKPNC